MTLSSFLLLTIFPALLPPAKATNPEDEFEYYTVLGFNLNEKDTIDITAIRKAYRKKSLQLHPDKVAQRGEHHATERTKKLYEQVQEAYNCLQNDQHRKVYHDYGCSVPRYRFVSGPTPEISNPISVSENLAKAPFALKTRIVLAVAIILLLFLLQPILIATKVNGEKLQSTLWTIILIPWWIIHVSVLLLLGTLVIISKFDLNVLCTFCECLSWLIGVILLAHEWDTNSKIDTTPTTNWNAMSTPFLVAIVIRILSCVVLIRTIRQMQSKMVTLSFLEKKLVSENILSSGENNVNTDTNTDGDNNETTTTTPTSLEDLSEEQQKELMKKYIIVSVDEDVEEAARQVSRAAVEQERAERGGIEDDPNNEHALNEEDIAEAIKVQSSDEYRVAETQKKLLHRKISYYLFCHVTFIILVTKKLTVGSRLYDTSWWIIFLPILLSIGLPLLWSCCICVSPVGIDPDPPIATAASAAAPAATAPDNAEAAANNNNNDNNNADDGNNDIETGTAKKSDPTSTTTFTFPNNNASNENNTAIEKEIENCSTMKISELKKELTEKYKINCSTFVEKSEFVNALAMARVNKSSGGGGTKPAEEAQRADDILQSSSGDMFAPTDSSSPTSKPVDTAAVPPAANGGPGTENWDDDDSILHDDEDDTNMNDAMKAKSNACVGCCWYSLQMILICVLIGKLEAEYDTDTDEGNKNNSGDDGYSAFWILFPIFLITGIILCCCSCLIYSLNGDEMNKFKNGGNSDNDNNENNATAQPTANGDVETPIVDENDTTNTFIPSPPPASTSNTPVDGGAAVSATVQDVAVNRSSNNDPMIEAAGAADNANATVDGTNTAIDDID